VPTVNHVMLLVKPEIRVQPGGIMKAND